MRGRGQGWGWSSICQAGGRRSMRSEGCHRERARKQFRADRIDCPLCESRTLVSWSRGMYAISLQGSNREYLRGARGGSNMRG